MFDQEKTNVTEVSPPNGRGSVQQAVCESGAEMLFFGSKKTINRRAKLKLHISKYPTFTKPLTLCATLGQRG
jgi:hypothetical protein